MKISKILNYQPNYKFLPLQNAKNAATLNSQQADIKNSKLPVGASSAVYHPSFCKRVHDKNVQIIDRNTGIVNVVSLNKENQRDLVRFSLTSKNKEIGSMFLKYDCPMPQKYCNNPEVQKTIPCVINLEIKQGDKFLGVGTALLNLAIEESIKNGKNGSLLLLAENSFPFYFNGTTLIESENSIQFYYKMGFEATDKELDDNIRKGLRTSNTESFPDEVLLFLPENRQGYLRRYYRTQNYRHIDAYLKQQKEELEKTEKKSSD